MNQQYKQFGFNPDSAKQADSSLRIEEAGKYVGVIKHMEFITAKSGTTGFEIADEIVRTWMKTEFAGGRHERRVNKIMALEAK